MSKPKLTFYFDLHSPYAYLAYQFIRHPRAFRYCEINYVPVHIIGFAKVGIANPPWNIPNKVSYLWRDVARWALEFDIPWRPGLPANYPDTRTSDVQRTLVACLMIAPTRLPEVLDVLYPAFWVEKKGLQKREVFETALESILGKHLAGEIVLKSRSDEARDKLRQNTLEAVESGAPGLPWFIAEDSSRAKDGFWGFDHIGLMSRFLKLPGNISSHL